MQGFHVDVATDVLAPNEVFAWSPKFTVSVAETRLSVQLVGGPADVPEQTFSARDAPVALKAAPPWFRPTVGIELTNGIGEIDAVAPFEVHASSWSRQRSVTARIKNTSTVA